MGDFRALQDIAYIIYPAATRHVADEKVKTVYKFHSKL